MKTDKILQVVAELLFAFYIVILFLEQYWIASKIVLYIVSGLLGLAVILFSILYGTLYKNIDTWLIILLFFYIFVSIVVNYGFSRSEEVTRFYCIWSSVFALYFIIQIIPDRERLMRVFAGVSVLPLGYICVSVILNASHAICQAIPPHDTLKGSFEMGRLCGLTNANILGMACAALILIALYGFLRAKKWFRLYYAAAIVLGWFTLGLTNSRTAIIGVSAAVSFFIVLVLQRKLQKLNSLHAVLRWILAVILFLGMTLLFIQCFYIPNYCYGFVAKLYGNWKHNPDLLNNISILSNRWIIDDDGTVADRVSIWIHSLRNIFSSPRRWIFGVSPIHLESIGGVYEGHHEIAISHSHNILIEVLRLYGIIGISIWLALVGIWCKAIVQVLRDLKINIPDLFLTAAVAGMLIMGATEPLPFLGISEILLSVPFVAMCGSIIKNRRSAKNAKE